MQRIKAFFQSKKQEKPSKLYQELHMFMEKTVKGNIKMKDGFEVGRRSVVYFRGFDFCRFVVRSSEMLVEKYPGILGANKLTKVKDAKVLGQSLIANGLIYKARYDPLHAVPKSEEGIIPKWPKRLRITADQAFDDNNFYVLIYEGSKSSQHLLLSLIIIVVLLFSMFSIWPIVVKRGVWYVIVFLMTFLLTFVVGRLLVFLGFWFFGLDAWILPNLFHDELDFIASFYPLYSLSKRNDDWFMISARILCAAMLCISVHQLGKTHRISDVSNVAAKQFLNLLEWGDARFTGDSYKFSKSPLFAQFYNNQALLDAGSPETADVIEESPPKEIVDLQFLYTPEQADGSEEDLSCLANCGYRNLDFFINRCITSAPCLKAVIEGECFKECNVITRNIIREMHEAASS